MAKQEKEKEKAVGETHAKSGTNKNKKTGRQNSGGESSKHAQALHEDKEQERQFRIDVAEGHDHKTGNIGPSGQGSHRGRESRTNQSHASGRH